MAVALRRELVVHERSVHGSRADMIGNYTKLIETIDEQNEWPLLISKAREAGLDKEQLCRELTCAWSTVTRWTLGHTAPGPLTRTAIKQKLLGMLAELRQSEERLADSLEYA